MDWITTLGIPTAIFSFLMGLLNWRIQKKLDVMDEKRIAFEKEREKNFQLKERRREKLILMQLQSTEAAIALSKATAKAVQRIPDAKCNGDMTRALEYTQEIQNKQKSFLFEVGIQSLCDDEEENYH